VIAMFEYYVLNYNWDKKCIENFNIFDNISLDNAVEKEVRKYLRSPKKYRYYKCSLLNCGYFYGFEGFCKALDSLIMWQEWGRREYEISVGDAFETDCDKLEKWDCYRQCRPNIPMIAREVIWQYKHRKEN
jgi:uncharacterized protein (UPF0147 family)